MDPDSAPTARVPARQPAVTSPSGSGAPGVSTTSVSPRSNLQSHGDENPQLSSQSINTYGNSSQQQQFNQTPTMNQTYSQTNVFTSVDTITTPTVNGSTYQSSASQATLVSSYPSAGNVSRGNPPSLAPIELPITRIRVVASHIRANDRGRDVLAFSIQVQPGQREPWVIEKMYSDVLALDSRVRNMLNKTTVKKLAPLPDSKLFKDNAPAKVDQRKALLEQYLQSVVTAPLKDVGDLCVFFCTDLSKGDRAPVANQGYKEGYLTKRGKNFGGWKTRYFILQNGVLEYYENVGSILCYFVEHVEV
jgi:RalA-binding protein 1